MVGGRPKLRASSTNLVAAISAQFRSLGLQRNAGYSSIDRKLTVPYQVRQDRADSVRKFQHTASTLH